MFALVTTESARGHDKDLGILSRALDASGVKWNIVNWDDPKVQWSDYSIAVLRSPWDYHERIAEFSAWLKVVATQTRLLNTLPIVEWNLDKRYLRELMNADIAVMETVFVESETDLSDGVFSRDVIVKPAISAGSNNTSRYKHDVVGATELARRLLNSSIAVLAQPYQSAIDEYGETGLVYLGGQFSHGFRKAPIFADNDQNHNGLYVVEEITLRIPSAAERAFGDTVVAFVKDKFGVSPWYARVDMVVNAAGVHELMELELTEPSLFLHLDDESPARAAMAFANAASTNER
jgi:O-ureido-D-serine cyclo-ligase